MYTMYVYPPDAPDRHGTQECIISTQEHTGLFIPVDVEIQCTFTVQVVIKGVKHHFVPSNMGLGRNIKNVMITIS